MDEPLSTQQLTAEIDRTIARYRGATSADLQTALVDDLLPLIRVCAESIGVRLDQTELAVHELITGTESILAQDVATRLLATLSLGNELCGAVLADKGAGKKTRELAVGLREAVGAAARLITDITAEDDDYSGGEDDEGDDGEGDGEGEAEEGEGDDGGDLDYVEPADEPGKPDA